MNMAQSTSEQNRSLDEGTLRNDNFLRQFRDLNSREFKRITASQFTNVWNNYDTDGNGFIEGKELDQFLYELVTSVNMADLGPQVISRAALEDAKQLVLSAFDENQDGRIDIAEVWREYDKDHSGFIEADELKLFLHDLLKLSKKDTEVSDEQLINYADTMLALFDQNKDGRLQFSEMAKLLPVKENFLLRPVFKVGKQLTKDDINYVFTLYDRDNNNCIENDELHGFLKDLMELVQEDYDSKDIEECKAILLKECDLNRDGKIDKEELAMVLMAFTKCDNNEGSALQQRVVTQR